MNAVDFLLGPHALARHGGRTALICGDVRVTFRELADSAARAASALVGLGVVPGDRVLILMRDTPEFAAAWLGTLRAGAIAVALNSKLSEADYRHILADSGARLAIIEDVFAASRADLTSELARERRIAIAGNSMGLPAWRELQGTAPDSAPFDARNDLPAFALYSSGTTGTPKGIVHSHNSVVHVGGALRRFGLSEGDRTCTTSKFFFAYGLEHGLLAPLALGATSILYPEWPTPASIAEIVARHKPAALFSVPTLYRRLLAEPPASLDAFRGVRRFVSGGERLSPQLVEHWRAAAGGELLNLYGMSETFCACIVTPAGTSDGVRTGTPLDGVEVRLEAEGGGPAEGEAGVLWIRHPAQAAGYVNLPRQTAEQFKDGWFCTRDLFARDAGGNYIHRGRSDDMVKIAGQWVSPTELEDLVGREAAITEAACVAVPDEDGLERLALFVVTNGDADQALRAAGAACDRTLPQHKRPKWLRAVEQLPRTATGKVQRFKLREILQQELSAKR